MRYIVRDRYEHNEKRYHRFEIYDVVEDCYLEKNEYPFDLDFNTYEYPNISITEIQKTLANYCDKLNFDNKFMEHIK